MGRAGGTPTHLRRYVAAWVVGGAILASSVILWDGALSPDLGAVLPLLVLTAVSEAVSVNLRQDQSGVALSLLEVAVVVNLMVLSPDGMIIAVVGGVTCQHLLRRLPPMKLFFNMGEHAAGAGVAAVIMALAPSGPLLSMWRVMFVGAAVLAYRLVNSWALAGVFQRLDAPELRDHLLHRPLVLLASTLGSASLGVIGLNVWTTNPSLVWVVAAPAVALYLAYVSSYRIEGLLADVRIERDRLDRVVGGVSEGIVLLDTAGLVQVWNRAMTTITGIAEGEALGRRADELLTGVDDHDDPVDPLDALAEDAAEQTVVVVHLRTTDGDLRPLRLTHTLLCDEGERTGDVLMVQDLTREREANALKEDFIAQVSHELRTPLSPLRGYAQALQQGGDRIPVEKRNEIHGLMVERVDHLARLVDDLLLVSSIGAGGSAPAHRVSRDPVELAPLVPRLVSWLSQEQVRGRRIEVVGDDGPRWALGDATRIGQVVTNLLTNACKYSDPDTVVTVRLRQTDERVQVAVTDRGPGVPEDKLEAVFERFRRLDDPQRMRAGGIGLGLYISRHLAEAMGGALTVASTRGVGSTFTLSLPVAPADARLVHADETAMA